jgi:hypothetical protein
MDVTLNRIETIFDRVAHDVRRIAACLEQLVQFATEASASRTPPPARDAVAADVVVGELKQWYGEKVEGLLNDISHLAFAIQKLGYAVPAVPRFGEQPAWVRAILDPTIAPLVCDVTIALRAACAREISPGEPRSLHPPRPQVRRARTEMLRAIRENAHRVQRLWDEESRTFSDGTPDRLPWPKRFEWFWRQVKHYRPHEEAAEATLTPVVTTEPPAETSQRRRRPAVKRPAKDAAASRRRR